MVQILFNINVILTCAFFGVGGFMLVSISLNAIHNVKNSKS